MGPHRSVDAKRHGLGSLALAFISVVAGCSPTRPAPPDASSALTTSTTPSPAVQPAWGADPTDRELGPLLFEARLPAGTVQLFGTMHTEPLSSMPRAASERFAAARTVAFEIDVETIDPGTVLKFARLPPGESLRRLIGDEPWERLHEYFDGAVPPAMLDGFRPWFVAASVMLKSSSVESGGELMDVALIQKSRADGKKMRFLETPEEQFAILDQTMDAATVVALTKQLDELPKFFQSMSESYRAGDVAELERAQDDNERWGMTDEQMKSLLGARNERWVPFMENLATEGGGFVAVGAGHLVGDDGLVALLRARGHPVVRVLETAKAR